MPLSGTLLADFSSFYAAIATAGDKVRGFMATAGEAGGKVAQSVAATEVSFKSLATAAGLVGGAVAGVAAGVAALGSRGADVADITEGFQTLTKEIGLSSDALLTRLQAATLGTISKIDLMKTANQALGQ